GTRARVRWFREGTKARSGMRGAGCGLAGEFGDQGFEVVGEGSSVSVTQQHDVDLTPINEPGEVEDECCTKRPRPPTDRDRGDRGKGRHEYGEIGTGQKRVGC